MPGDTNTDAARAADGSFWRVAFDEYPGRSFIRYLVRDPSDAHVMLVGFARDIDEAMRLINEQIALVTQESEAPPDSAPPGTLTN